MFRYFCLIPTHFADSSVLSAEAQRSLHRCRCLRRCHRILLSSHEYAAIKLIKPKQPTIILSIEVERNTCVSNLKQPLVRELNLNWISCRNTFLLFKRYWFKFFLICSITFTTQHTGELTFNKQIQLNFFLCWEVKLKISKIKNGSGEKSQFSCGLQQHYK